MTANERIGNWYKLKMLGEGGQGRVYLARHVEGLRARHKCARKLTSTLKKLLRASEEIENAQDYSIDILDLGQSALEAIDQWGDAKDEKLGAVKEFHVSDSAADARKHVVVLNAKSNS